MEAREIEAEREKRREENGKGGWKEGQREEREKGGRD